MLDRRRPSSSRPADAARPRRVRAASTKRRPNRQKARRAGHSVTGTEGTAAAPREFATARTKPALGRPQRTSIQTMIVDGPTSDPDLESARTPEGRARHPFSDRLSTPTRSFVRTRRPAHPVAGAAGAPICRGGGTVNRVQGRAAHPVDGPAVLAAPPGATAGPGPATGCTDRPGEGRAAHPDRQRARQTPYRRATSAPRRATGTPDALVRMTSAVTMNAHRAGQAT
jgi:hypothetical protein